MIKTLHYEKAIGELLLRQSKFRFCKYLGISQSDEQKVRPSAAIYEENEAADFASTFDKVIKKIKEQQGVPKEIARKPGVCCSHPGKSCKKCCD